MSKQTILFAGYGLAPAPAEVAAGLGIENFILIGGDTVEESNLNRQSIAHADIGQPKVEALKKRILSVNPRARVKVIHDFVTPENVFVMVDRVDVIFDTIDFLEHEECLIKKPVF